jgi:ABC-2 type transport system ATP-binding protein
MSAWQNLLYFGRLKGLRAREIKPRARRLLTELGLWERRDELVGSYSRCMQQKVAIAAALITDPPILLLDEPTLGLDVAAARTVRDWITHLSRDEHKTVVLTTHQFAIAQELPGRIAVIRGGQIIADLPTPRSAGPLRRRPVGDSPRRGSGRPAASPRSPGRGRRRIRPDHAARHQPG